MARIVVPGYPHHVTQRGIRGYRTFFSSLDYLMYCELLRAALPSSGARLWAYCLMPNHIHAIVVPESEDSLAKLFRQVHSQYALKTNAARGWKGHLWQERFFSTPMDEQHALAALRYVVHNPVRAGLCDTPEEWRWSSVHAHLGTRQDDLVDMAATKDIVTDWSVFLEKEAAASVQESLRKNTRTGRPAGTENFIDELERELGRAIPRTSRRSSNSRK